MLVKLVGWRVVLEISGDSETVGRRFKTSLACSGFWAEFCGMSALSVDTALFMFLKSICAASSFASAHIPLESAVSDGSTFSLHVLQIEQ